MRVWLVGGRVGRGVPAVARMNLDGLNEVEHAMGPPVSGQGASSGWRWRTRGLWARKCRRRGSTIDHGPDQPGPWQYTFAANDLTEWQFPMPGPRDTRRGPGSKPRTAFRGFLDQLYATRGLAPQRFPGHGQN